MTQTYPLVPIFPHNWRTINDADLNLGRHDAWIEMIAHLGLEEFQTHCISNNS